MIVFDAHAHIGSPEELAARRQHGVRTMFSCGNPAQAEEVSALCKGNPLFTMTAGVHPWYADRVTLEDMVPYMERAALVGEIGLDSVWCDVPMDAQRRVFERQLDWAAAHGKGIVLHTKGCEKEIAQRVKGFPHPVIVHWYSGEDDALLQFLSQGCYMTIGPDVPANVTRLTPDDRILFETDGMDAVRWALGNVPDGNVQDVLWRSVQRAALLRIQDAGQLARKANENYRRLLDE